MEKDLAIRIVDICKQFGHQKVLDGVSLDIERGKITVIIGKSGGGKSVLLKHLIGLLKPDSGEIWVDGVDIARIGEKELNKIRKGFGMLFQEAALFDSMNVFDNIAFPLREHTKMGEDEIGKAVEGKLSQVGLTGFGEKMPSELSGGMRKRVGLARALVMDPDIILFDEPTSALDPVIAQSIQELIKETQTHLRKTYVIISHDILGMFRIADKVAMLSNGKIVSQGTPYEVSKSPDEAVREFMRALIMPDVSGGEHGESKNFN